MVSIWQNIIGVDKVKVLICKEDENVLQDISVSGVFAVLGYKPYIQRIVLQKAGYRLCIWYSEEGKGIKRKVQLCDGEKITVKGTYIICHEEYGAYEDITAEDRADFMSMVEG